MDQLFALGHVYTGTKILELAPALLRSKRAQKKPRRRAGLSLGCSHFLLIVTTAAGHRAAEFGGAGSAQRGRTVGIAVRIAVVGAQSTRACQRHTPMQQDVSPDARLMTNRICKRECTGEHQHRRGQRYCRKFHDCVLLS